MSVNAIMSAIQHYPVLTRSEEYAIALRAFRGDFAAQEQLVCHNLRIALKVAYQYHHGELDDRIQLACLGLIDASRSFNPTRRCRFYGYAMLHVRSKFSHEKTQSHYHKREIAHHLTHSDTESAEEIITMVPAPTSTDRIAQQQESRAILLAAIETLPSAERAVVLCRYQLGQAVLPKHSRQYHQQLERQGLARLKRFLQRHDLTLQDLVE